MRLANALVPAEEVGEGPDARERIVARRPSEQCCMYHICTADCQIQFPAPEEF